MLCCCDYVILALSALILLYFRLANSKPKPILNIYQRKNGFYWFKVLFMYAILKLRQIRSKPKTKEEFHKLDKPQPFSSHEKAIDAVYFNASKNGDHLVLGTARRKNKLIDGFLYLKLKDSDLGILETPKLPGTALYKTKDDDSYEAEGLKVAMIEPMKKWNISYKGQMKRFENRSEVLDVELQAEWTSQQPFFNFDTDMDPLTMAKSMAFETWSRDYFKNVQKNHQTHYEQHGELKGFAVINGKRYEIDMNSVRDHSFGEYREWRTFHRYGLHFLSTENGDRFNVGMICLPMSFSRLTVGYVYQKSTDKIYPVTDCDLQLYQHGENGNPPLDYAFSFKAGKQNYTIQVKVTDSPHFYISKDWESKVVERLCEFTVNGIKGWGAAEWQYRNIDGKSVPDYFEIKQ